MIIKQGQICILNLQALTYFGNILLFYLIWFFFPVYLDISPNIIPYDKYVLLDLDEN